MFRRQSLKNDLGRERDGRAAGAGARRMVTVQKGDSVPLKTVHVWTQQ